MTKKIKMTKKDQNDQKRSKLPEIIKVLMQRDKNNQK